MSHSIAAHDSIHRARHARITRPIAQGAPAAHGHPKTRGLTVTEIALLAVLVIAFVAAVLAVAGPAAVSAPHMTSVTVESGQNLWALATQYPVPGCTTAETVEIITRANNLPSATVAAGTQLLVPASEQSGSLALR